MKWYKNQCLQYLKSFWLCCQHVAGERILNTKEGRHCGAWVLFELSAWMRTLLRIKEKAVKNETKTEMLASPINKRGQEANRWQHGTPRLAKTDVVHIKDRKTDSLAAENRRISVWSSFPEIGGVGEAQLLSGRPVGAAAWLEHGQVVLTARKGWH